MLPHAVCWHRPMLPPVSPDQARPARAAVMPPPAVPALGTRVTSNNGGWCYINTLPSHIIWPGIKTLSWYSDLRVPWPQLWCGCCWYKAYKAGITFLWVTLDLLWSMPCGCTGLVWVWSDRSHPYLGWDHSVWNRRSSVIIKLWK